MTENTDQTYTVALTGHRPDRLAGYDMSHPFYRVLHQELSSRVQALLGQHQQLELRSGLALGADTIWAQVGLQLREQHPGRIRIAGYLPFPDQAGRWPKSSRDTWAQIRHDLDREHICAESYSASVMHRRNAVLIQDADLLLALWDGKPTGGTAGTVRLARAQNTLIQVIDPEQIRRTVNVS